MKNKILGVDIIEHDLLYAFKYYNRLEPNSSIEDQLKKAIETVTHYMLSDLNQAAINVKNKITKNIWDI